MSAVPSLDAARTAALLDWPAVVADLLGALAAPGLVRTPPRTALTAPGGELLVMPAVSDRWAGVKIAAVGNGHNPAQPRIQSTYTLFDAVTLTPRVHLDGSVLTVRRTAALSALALQLLTIPRAARVVILGTGPQALAHAEALHALRMAGQLILVGRRPEAGMTAAALLADRGIPARVGIPQDVAGSDVVVCCTTAATPLFDSSILAPGCRVVAIGSHRPTERELDTALMGRAEVVVEDPDLARREAGEVILAESELGHGVIDGTLANLASGRWPPDPGRTAVFKSVGAGWQDLAAAAGAVARRGS